MTTLQNFPMLNQKVTTLSDGSADPNQLYDCVPTTIAAALQYLTGKAYQGGVLKEAVYGRSYQGATSAAAYVQYCAQQGVRLSSLQGNSGQLVQLAHQQVQAGHPAIGTEPDPYVDLSQFPGTTHVICFFGEDTHTLTAMDPFGGFAITQTDSVWAQTLVDGEIWIIEKLEDTVTISLTTPGLSNYFSQAPGNAWKCIKPNNPYVIGNAILSFYRMFGGAALCGLTYLGLPLSNETSVAGHAGVTEQAFERATVRYDPQHVLDSPPGSGAVYLIHQSTSSSATQAQINQAQSMVIDLQHKLAAISQIIVS